MRTEWHLDDFHSDCPIAHPCGQSCAGRGLVDGDIAHRDRHLDRWSETSAGDAADRVACFIFDCSTFAHGCTSLRLQADALALGAILDLIENYLVPGKTAFGAA